MIHLKTDKIEIMCANVYYNNLYRKCAANGYSAYKEEILIVKGKKKDCIKECNKLIEEKEAEKEDFYYLNERILWGEKHFFLEMLYPKIKGHQMAGGNFAYSSDSRYREITGMWTPIPIHDRIEPWS